MPRLQAPPRFCWAPVNHSTRRAPSSSPSLITQIWHASTQSRALIGSWVSDVMVDGDKVARLTSIKVCFWRNKTMFHQNMQRNTYYMYKWGLVYSLNELFPWRIDEISISPSEVGTFVLLTWYYKKPLGTPNRNLFGFLKVRTRRAQDKALFFREI